MILISTKVAIKKIRFFKLYVVLIISKPSIYFFRKTLVSLFNLSSIIVTTQL